MRKLFQSQESLIADIHNAFDTAEDRLLEQANALLKERAADTVTNVEVIGERLAKTGFVNTPTALKGKQIKTDREENRKVLVKTEDQANLINYYKRTYPFLKFLTEDELNRICDKYSLIHAPVANYIEEVPEKNLRDIEIAQGLKDYDATEELIYFKCSRRPNDQKRLDDTLAKLGLINGVITEHVVDAIIDNFLPNDKWSQAYYKETWRKDSNSWLYRLCTSSLFGGDPYYNYDSIEKSDRSGLFIAAPPSHFNLKDLQKKSKHGFFKVFETEVKDPIVFRYVRGGVQVITKWGLEANDPTLVVSVFN